MTGTGPHTTAATGVTAGDAAGVDAVVVGPLAVDYTIYADPADARPLLADRLPDTTGSAGPVRQVVDQATIMRVLAALRGRVLYAEPGSRTLRVARHLATDHGRRVGVVGVAGQTLSPDLAIHAELARHAVEHRHVTADEGLSGITVTVTRSPHTGATLVYGGGNRRLAAVLRRDQPAIAAYLAGAPLVHAVLPDDPTVVSALTQVLAVARRMNPDLRVSLDASAYRDHQTEQQLTGLVAMADVLIGAADADLRHLLDQPPPRIDPGAVVQDVRASRPGLTVLDIAADRVDVCCPDGVVATVRPRAAGAPALDGDRVASALTAAVLTAVDQGGEVVAAVEAAISTAQQWPPPVPAEAAIVTSPRAARRRAVARMLFGRPPRRRAVAWAVALLGWPVAVLALVMGWPVLLYAALTIPYLVLRLAPVVFQACSRTRPAAAKTGHRPRAAAPLDADPTGFERSGR